VRPIPTSKASRSCVDPRSRCRRSTCWRLTVICWAPGQSRYMSGALNHFFDTVDYPSLDHVAGRPYGLWVHGNNDTVGATTSVEKVATGLSLVKAADVLEITGAIDARARERAYELGGTLAATLME
jgi:hypothetical protein